MDQEFLQNLLTYWADGFDWRTQEERLNRYDHWIAEIDGIRLHFVSQRGYGERLPLILLHGWPSSFVEMLSLVDRLGDRFDLVVPSLPGYAFSSRPRRTGVDRAYVAEVCHRLMDGLGYPRYGAYGADFGAGVATHMALSHPGSLVGIHLSTAEMTPYTGPGAAPLAGRACIPRRRRCLGPRRARLQLCAIHPSADARIRPSGLPGRPGRVGAGQVAVMVGQRGRPGRDVRPGGAADAADRVVGHWLRHVVDARLLRQPMARDAARAG